jgi:hypothetical protein
MSTTATFHYNPLAHAATTAWGILTTREAIRWYRDTTKSLLAECFLCFCEGLVVLMAGTLRAGQILRELIHSAYQVILEVNAPIPTPVLALPQGPAPIALLPAVAMPHPDRIRIARQAIKEVARSLDNMGIWDHGSSILIPPAVIPAAAQEAQPKPRRRGRKPKAVA